MKFLILAVSLLLLEDALARPQLGIGAAVGAGLGLQSNVNAGLGLQSNVDAGLGLQSNVTAGLDGDTTSSTDDIGTTAGGGLGLQSNVTLDAGFEANTTADAKSGVKLNSETTASTGISAETSGGAKGEAQSAKSATDENAEIQTSTENSVRLKANATAAVNSNSEAAPKTTAINATSYVLASNTEPAELTQAERIQTTTKANSSVAYSTSNTTASAEAQADLQSTGSESSGDINELSTKASAETNTTDTDVNSTNYNNHTQSSPTKLDEINTETPVAADLTRANIVSFPNRVIGNTTSHASSGNSEGLKGELNTLSPRLTNNTNYFTTTTPAASNSSASYQTTLSRLTGGLNELRNRLSNFTNIHSTTRPGAANTYSREYLSQTSGLNGGLNFNTNRLSDFTNVHSTTRPDAANTYSREYLSQTSGLNGGLNFNTNRLSNFTNVHSTTSPGAANINSREYLSQTSGLNGGLNFNTNRLSNFTNVHSTTSPGAANINSREYLSQTSGLNGGLNFDTNRLYNFTNVHSTTRPGAANINSREYLSQTSGLNGGLNINTNHLSNFTNVHSASPAAANINSQEYLSQTSGLNGGINLHSSNEVHRDTQGTTILPNTASTNLNTFTHTTAHNIPGSNGGNSRSSSTNTMTAAVPADGGSNSNTISETSSIVAPPTVGGLNVQGSGRLNSGHGTAMPSNSAVNANSVTQATVHNSPAMGGGSNQALTLGNTNAEMRPTYSGSSISSIAQPFPSTSSGIQGGLNVQGSGGLNSNVHGTAMPSNSAVNANSVTQATVLNLPVMAGGSNQALTLGNTNTEMRLTNSGSSISSNAQHSPSASSGIQGGLNVQGSGGLNSNVHGTAMPSNSAVNTNSVTQARVHNSPALAGGSNQALTLANTNAEMRPTSGASTINSIAQPFPTTSNGIQSGLNVQGSGGLNSNVQGTALPSNSALNTNSVTRATVHNSPALTGGSNPALTLANTNAEKRPTSGASTINSIAQPFPTTSSGIQGGLNVQGSGGLNSNVHGTALPSNSAVNTKFVTQATVHNVPSLAGGSNQALTLENTNAEMRPASSASTINSIVQPSPSTSSGIQGGLNVQGSSGLNSNVHGTPMPSISTNNANSIVQTSVHNSPALTGGHASTATNTNAVTSAGSGFQPSNVGVQSSNAMNTNTPIFTTPMAETSSNTLASASHSSASPARLGLGDVNTQSTAHVSPEMFQQNNFRPAVHATQFQSPGTILPKGHSAVTPASTTNTIGINSNLQSTVPTSTTGINTALLRGINTNSETIGSSHNNQGRKDESSTINAGLSQALSGKILQPSVSLVSNLLSNQDATSEPLDTEFKARLSGNLITRQPFVSTSDSGSNQETVSIPVTADIHGRLHGSKATRNLAGGTTANIAALSPSIQLVNKLDVTNNVLHHAKNALPTSTNINSPLLEVNSNTLKNSLNSVENNDSTTLSTNVGLEDQKSIGRSSVSNILPLKTEASNITSEVQTNIASTRTSEASTSESSDSNGKNSKQGNSRSATSSLGTSRSAQTSESDATTSDTNESDTSLQGNTHLASSSLGTSRSIPTSDANDTVSPSNRSDEGSNVTASSTLVLGEEVTQMGLDGENYVYDINGGIKSESNAPINSTGDLVSNSDVIGTSPQFSSEFLVNASSEISSGPSITQYNDVNTNPPVASNLLSNVTADLSSIPLATPTNDIDMYPQVSSNLLTDVSSDISSGPSITQYNDVNTNPPVTSDLLTDVSADVSSVPLTEQSNDINMYPQVSSNLVSDVSSDVSSLPLISQTNDVNGEQPSDLMTNASADFFSAPMTTETSAVNAYPQLSSNAVTNVFSDVSSGPSVMQSNDINSYPQESSNLVTSVSGDTSSGPFDASTDGISTFSRVSSGLMDYSGSNGFSTDLSDSISDGVNTQSEISNSLSTNNSPGMASPNFAINNNDLSTYPEVMTHPGISSSNIVLNSNILNTSPQVLLSPKEVYPQESSRMTTNGNNEIFSDASSSSFSSPISHSQLLDQNTPAAVGVANPLVANAFTQAVIHDALPAITQSENNRYPSVIDGNNNANLIYNFGIQPEYQSSHIPLASAQTSEAIHTSAFPANVNTQMNANGAKSNYIPTYGLNNNYLNNQISQNSNLNISVPHSSWTGVSQDVEGRTNHPVSSNQYTNNQITGSSNTPITQFNPYFGNNGMHNFFTNKTIEETFEKKSRKSEIVTPISLPSSFPNFFSPGNYPIAQQSYQQNMVPQFNQLPNYWQQNSNGMGMNMVNLPYTTLQTNSLQGVPNSVLQTLPAIGVTVPMGTSLQGTNPNSQLMTNTNANGYGYYPVSNSQPAMQTFGTVNANSGSQLYQSSLNSNNNILGNAQTTQNFASFSPNVNTAIQATQNTGPALNAGFNAEGSGGIGSQNFMTPEANSHSGINQQFNNPTHYTNTIPTSSFGLNTAFGIGTNNNQPASRPQMPNSANFVNVNNGASAGQNIAPGFTGINAATGGMEGNFASNLNSARIPQTPSGLAAGFNANLKANGQFSGNQYLNDGPRVSNNAAIQTLQNSPIGLNGVNSQVSSGINDFIQTPNPQWANTQPQTRPASTINVAPQASQSINSNVNAAVSTNTGANGQLATQTAIQSSLNAPTVSTEINANGAVGINGHNQRPIAPWTNTQAQTSPTFNVGSQAFPSIHSNVNAAVSTNTQAQTRPTSTFNVAPQASPSINSNVNAAVSTNTQAQTRPTSTFNVAPQASPSINSNVNAAVSSNTQAQTRPTSTFNVAPQASPSINSNVNAAVSTNTQAQTRPTSTFNVAPQASPSINSNVNAAVSTNTGAQTRPTSISNVTPQASPSINSNVNAAVSTNTGAQTRPTSISNVTPQASPTINSNVNTAVSTNTQAQTRPTSTFNVATQAPPSINSNVNAAVSTNTGTNGQSTTQTAVQSSLNTPTASTGINTQSSIGLNSNNQNQINQQTHAQTQSRPTATAASTNMNVAASTNNGISSQTTTRPILQPASRNPSSSGLNVNFSSGVNANTQGTAGGATVPAANSNRGSVGLSNGLGLGLQLG